MSIAPDGVGRLVHEDARRLALRENTSWMRDNPDVLPLPFTWAKDYGAIAAPETIVAGLLEAGTLAVMFGESNTGKSTFALDMAAAVARGTTWRGRRTKRGVVLWIALESAAGLRRRVAAYARRHDIDLADVLLVDITARVRLLDALHVERIVSTARTLAAVTGEPVAMIVVDTVARALDGGDENDGRDMGRLVAACDAIRTETGAAVLLIHHSGKDSTRGARGHSSLRAAVDTEIEVSGQANPRQAKVTKQRDLPSGDVFAFDLEPVEVATAEDGEPVTACVVAHREDVATAPKMPTGKAQASILCALRNQQRDHKGVRVWTLADMRTLGRELGQSKTTAWSAVDGLTLSGLLVPTVGGHRLAEAKETTE